ncbi:MAG: tetratricopeptide repeat protein [Kiritimatiellae bacterium]|nr:tetratricopeptide repeat protein [Kiritimatiellia bacterium]
MHRSTPIAAMLFVLTVAVFWPAADHEFVAWDDEMNISANPLLNPVSARSVAAMWRHWRTDLYPLTQTWWALLARAGRAAPEAGPCPPLDPWPFHFSNVILHALAVVCVFALLRRLLAACGADTPARSRNWAAATGAVLFALHPVQAESVAWATGAKELLWGLFSLLALLQYVHYAARAELPARERRAGRGLRACAYAGGLLCFLCALLAKPTAVAVPFVAWVLARLCVGRGAWRAARDLLPWFVLSGVWMILAFASQQPHVTAATRLAARPLIVLDTVAFYVYRLLAPVWLSPDYGRTPARVLQLGPAYFAAILLGLVALGLLVRRREHRHLWLAAGAVFVLCLAPVTGLVPFVFQAHSTVADRYLYLAMLGPALLAARGALHLKRRTAALGYAFGCGALSVLCSLQLHVWRDTRTLFEHALHVNPASYAALNNLGTLSLDDGRTAEALGFYRRALRARPDFSKTHYNLGLVFARAGAADRALSHYSAALRLNPRYAAAHNRAGVALAERGELHAATNHYHHALALADDYAEPHFNLANALRRLGATEQALHHLREAIRIRPDYAEAYYNLANVLAQTSNTVQSIPFYRQAIQIRPGYVEARFNLGSALAALGRLDEAMQQYSEVLRMAPGDSDAWQALERVRRAKAAAEPGGR